MPREKIRCIFKLRCKDENVQECYFGGSNNFNKYRSVFRSSCNNTEDRGHNRFINIFIRENGGFDNWQFDILDEFKEPITKKEIKEYLIPYYNEIDLSLILNKQDPNSKQDIQCVYIIKFKDPKIKECYIGSTICFFTRKIQHKAACNNEKDDRYIYPLYKLIRSNGGWSNTEMTILEECPGISETELREKEKHYIYSTEHTLNILNPSVPGRTDSEYWQQYKDKHKAQIKARQSMVIECECGKNFTGGNTANHKLSKHHQNWEYSSQFIFEE